MYPDPEDELTPADLFECFVILGLIWFLFEMAMKGYI